MLGWCITTSPKEESQLVCNYEASRQTLGSFGSMKPLCRHSFISVQRLQDMPGSSPSGSRVIRRGDGIGVLGKNLFNYRYKERLERNSVVGKLVEKKRLNNLVYVEYQSPPTQATCVFPFSQRRGGTEASPVRSQKPRQNQQAWQVPMLQMGIQPEKQRTRKK